jgi:hypothetical protein
MCIYCRKATEGLTEEHIVPLALNGSWIIDGAACEPCRAHSNKAYENPALQCDMIRVSRRLLELKRRKKNRPILMPPVFSGDTAALTSVENLERIYLEADEYPPIFTMLRFEPAGKLVGIDRRNGNPEIRLWMLNIGKPNGKPRSNITVRHAFDHVAFARMIAKIGYCYAVAERGLDSFDSTEILQLLRSERDDCYNLVGGSLNGERLTSRVLHHLSIRRRGNLLTVIVHLFSSYNAPPYEVVVGTI